jgi:hypothetical protein
LVTRPRGPLPLTASQVDAVNAGRAPRQRRGARAAVARAWPLPTATTQAPVSAPAPPPASAVAHRRPPSPTRAITSPTATVSPTRRDGPQHALGLRGIGHRRLVGLDLDELLSNRDRRTVRDEPGDDRALLHLIREGGHEDVGHVRSKRSSDRADDGVGVDAEVAVEVRDVAGLAEVLDAQAGDRRAL